MNSKTCKFCEKEFSSISCLNRHVRTTKKCQSDDINKITYDCDFCKKKLTSKRMLEYHSTICKLKKKDKKDPILTDLINQVKKISIEIAKRKEEQNKEKQEIQKEKINIINQTEIVSKKYKKKTIPKTLKMTVWYTHIGKEIGMVKCPCCNSNEISQMDFDCGHIIAESKGGSMTLENLKPICNKCNRSMRTMNMIEFKQKYFK